MSKPTRAALTGLLCAGLLCVSGCASTSSSSATLLPGTGVVAGSAAGDGGLLSDVTDKALTMLGFKQQDGSAQGQTPKVPDSALPDWRVDWRVAASQSLNIDENGQSLALIVRFYKLRSPDAFLNAPYDAFGDPAKEKALLNEDLIAARELQLIPGQYYEAADKVTREARYIGVVALYRDPSVGRWRYAFKADAAERSGITLGAHACALSVQTGEAVGHTTRAIRSAAIACP